MGKDTRKILISGASIAGPTLAFWLHKSGFDVSVVERAPSLRLGGQNIDVTGPGRLVARRMGIEDAIRDANTGEIGTHFVDEDNNITATFAKGDPNGLTTELEILRGDLVNILYERTKQNVRYVFDDFITDLQQDDGRVTVTFASGQTDTYDLVIAADGIRSKTRKLMFGDEPLFDYLGLCTAYLTIPKVETDSNWARWYTAVDSRMILLRPDNKGTTRASINFLLPQEQYDSLAPADYKKLLLAKLTDAGWEAPRIRREVERSEDIYFDGVGQIKAPRWSKGRLAIVGDAAYCPSPLTGKGTTLAMVGAYVLAGELARHEHYRDAFAAYESRMRPYVKSVQQLPPGVPWLVYPESRFGVYLVNKAFGVVASDTVKKIGDFFNRNKSQEAEESEGISLPEYDV